MKHLLCGTVQSILPSPQTTQLCTWRGSKHCQSSSDGLWSLLLRTLKDIDGNLPCFVPLWKITWKHGEWHKRPTVCPCFWSSLELVSWLIKQGDSDTLAERTTATCGATWRKAAWILMPLSYWHKRWRQTKACVGGLDICTSHKVSWIQHCRTISYYCVVPRLTDPLISPLVR